ncbi:MAG: hypothetical protein MUE41_10285, partial [Gemmatimonadaceae bacterium]|nr:hypothetical protein [Gemmatimonadaceae bacterium]
GAGGTEGQGTGTRNGSGDGGARMQGGIGGSGQGAPSGLGRGGSFTVDEARQLSRELEARREAAQELRRALRGSGVDLSALDRVIARLGALDGAAVLGDARALAQLRTSVVDAMKDFEFTVRRRLGDTGLDGAAAGGGDPVGAQYRELVNAYFRALSSRP